MYTIYKIINNINNKCYIGQTKTDLKERFRRHKNLKSGTMYPIIKSFGAENFSIIPIDYADNKSESINKEVFWTLFYKANEPDYGYNKMVGFSLYGRIVSEETRQKISEANKGKTGLLGEKNPNYGKPLPQETKIKISNTLKGKYVGEKNPWYGKHHSSETLKKLSGENHWTTRQQYPKSALKKKHDALYRKPSGRSRAIRCVETGEVLPFAKEFYYKYGYQHSKILECCKGRRKTHHGLHWEYAD